MVFWVSVMLEEYSICVMRCTCTASEYGLKTLDSTIRFAKSTLMTRNEATQNYPRATVGH